MLFKSHRPRPIVNYHAYRPHPVLHMAEKEGQFELLASCTIGGVLAQKYRSLKTGIVVCLAQVEGPLVNGFFCLGKYNLYNLYF